MTRSNSLLHILAGKATADIDAAEKGKHHHDDHQHLVFSSTVATRKLLPQIINRASDNARLKICLTALVVLCGCAPAVAFGFTFGGSGRDFPYPNEPQYQYPGKDMRKCPNGFAPYRGQCRKIRWVQ